MMRRTLVEELRYLLAAAATEIPRTLQLEQHAARGPGARTFHAGEDAGYMGGIGKAANVEIADSAVSTIQVDYEEGFGGCRATLFVREGTLAELRELVREWYARPASKYDEVVGAVASAGAHDVELEVHHREGRISMINVCFGRVRGKYCRVLAPGHLTPIADEVRAVLSLAGAAPVDASTVARWLRSRGLAITTTAPWWAAEVGRNEGYATLAGSTAYGIRFYDDPRGWGCDVVLYTAYGSPADVEQVVGPLGSDTLNCDDFSGRRTRSTRYPVSNFDITVAVEHIDGHIASVRVQFPSKPRRVEEPPDEPTPPPGPPPSEPYRPSRTDVAVLEVRMLETGRVVHHEVDRSFLLGSSPDCDIVVPWNNPWMPNQNISIRIAIAAGRMQIVESSGIFQLDDWPIDLRFPHYLSVGSRLTAGKSLEITIMQLPS